jgi:hypothetical protein
MNNPRATDRYVQTAFLQVEGELCLKGAFPAQKRRRKVCSTRITRHRRRYPALVRASDVASLPHTREPENYSIPIDRGPAQFNAFYPPCSGLDLGSFHRIDRRSTADRILNIIGSLGTAHCRAASASRTESGKT